MIPNYWRRAEADPLVNAVNRRINLHGWHASLNEITEAHKPSAVYLTIRASAIALPAIYRDKEEWGVERLEKFFEALWRKHGYPYLDGSQKVQAYLYSGLLIYTCAELTPEQADAFARSQDEEGAERPGTFRRSTASTSGRIYPFRSTPSVDRANTRPTPDRGYDPNAGFGGNSYWVIDSGPWRPNSGPNTPNNVPAVASDSATGSGSQATAADGVGAANGPASSDDREYFTEREFPIERIAPADYSFQAIARDFWGLPPTPPARTTNDDSTNN